MGTSCSCGHSFLRCVSKQGRLRVHSAKLRSHTRPLHAVALSVRTAAARSLGWASCVRSEHTSFLPAGSSEQASLGTYIPAHALAWPFAFEHSYCSEPQPLTMQNGALDFSLALGLLSPCLRGACPIDMSPLFGHAPLHLRSAAFACRTPDSRGR